MNTYYIPCSSLNFNNIMSSESISPRAFYTERNFGFVRWTSLYENEPENVIILYVEPFCFDRPKSDLEDHSMLIEVHTDETFPEIENHSKMCYCNHTIYLSPHQCCFYFFNEQDMRVALSLSDSSMEVKPMRIYKNRIFCVTSFPHRVIERVQLDLPLNKESIESDKRINKLKGFFYGYYIGQLKSMDEDSVYASNLLWELNDVIAASLSNVEQRPSTFQQKEISKCISKLSELDIKQSGWWSALAKFIQNQSVINDCYRELVFCGVKFPMKYQDFERVILSEIRIDKESGLCPASLGVNKLIADYDRQSLKEQIQKITLSEDLVIRDKKLTEITNSLGLKSKEMELLLAWTNDILSIGEYDENISTYAANLSDALTDKAIDVYGEEWKDSNVRRQLNAIRRIIRNTDAEIDWSNVLTTSVAAVLLRGNEWQKILRFLKNKEMTDYSIAFAIYGELCGYANLNRDFTDVLFERVDDKKDWFNQLYIGCYKSLHGVLLKNVPLKNLVKMSDISESSPDSTWSVVARQNAMKMPPKTKKQILSAIEKYKMEHTPESFLDAILADKELDFMKKNGPSKAWNTLRDAIAPNYRQQKKHISSSKPQKVTQPNLFSDHLFELRLKSLSGRQLASILFEQQIISDSSVFDELSNDIDWLINRQAYKYQSVDVFIRSVESLLNTFKNKPKSKNGRDLSRKNNIYKNLDIPGVIQFLKENLVP